MPGSKKIAQKERREEKRMKEHLTDDVHNFMKIYDEEWADAHEILGHRRRPEKDIAAILLEIVQRAFTFNRDDANQQLSKAQICAKQIIACNNLKIDGRIQGPAGGDIAEELREYRYLQANRALPRARKEFLDKEFPKVLKKHDIARNNISKELEKYLIKCVDVTWHLCAEDPPIFMDLNDQQPFDEKLFESITKKGPKIDYILWPALKRSRDGPVLVKGMVACKR